MADSPTTTNQTAASADQVIHGLIFDVAVKAAQEEAIASLPFLALPLLKQITYGLLSLVAGKIYDKLATVVTFAIIDYQTSSEAKEANIARDKLKQAIQGGTPDEIDQATEAFKKAFGNLVHFDGSSIP